VPGRWVVEGIGFRADCEFVDEPISTRRRREEGTEDLISLLFGSLPPLLSPTRYDRPAVSRRQWRLQRAMRVRRDGT